jgi:RhtB (resistance to homoserine/threonine) family protein
VPGLWAQFLKLAVAHLLAVAAPGPDFAMVVRQSLLHGRRAAIWTSIGIGTAILIHITYALLGLGFLLKASPRSFLALQYVGAAYLAWIGWKGLSSRPHATLSDVPESAKESLQAPAQPTAAGAFTTGFLTNIFNPKATFFFVALWATLVNPATPKLIQAAWGLWMSGTTMAWFTLVSLLFTGEAVRSTFLRAGHWIDRAMGAVFIALAVVLALASTR